jgi:hypothetical protein
MQKKVSCLLFVCFVVFDKEADVTGVEIDALDEWIDKLNDFKENAFIDWRKGWIDRA